MKTSSSSKEKESTWDSKKGAKNRVENKDNLDSREKQEQLKKGGDMTHNKKVTKSKK